MPRTTVPVPAEVYDLFRFGAVLHGLTLRDYMTTVVAEWVRASNEVQLAQPLRLLRDGRFRSTPHPATAHSRSLRPRSQP